MVNPRCVSKIASPYCNSSTCKALKNCFTMKVNVLDAVCITSAYILNSRNYWRVVRWKMLTVSPCSSLAGCLTFSIHKIDYTWKNLLLFWKSGLRFNNSWVICWNAKQEAKRNSKEKRHSSLVPTWGLAPKTFSQNSLTIWKIRRTYDRQVTHRHWCRRKVLREKG